MGSLFECCDVPISAIYAVPAASRQTQRGEVIIYPGGMARAEIIIPDHLDGPVWVAHTRSGPARFGIQTAGARVSLVNNQTLMNVGIMNWAPYGILVRDGDPVIALANSSVLLMSSPIDIILLHAGATMLAVKWHLLGRIGYIDRYGQRKSIACLDPYSVRLPQIVTEIHWTGRWFERNRFCVIDTVEQPRIPAGHTGIIRWIEKGFTHSAAILDHGGSFGKRALEVMVSRKKAWLEPGMLVAALHIYPTPHMRPSPGTYHNRASIVPLSMAAR